jgi:hypothetical protein
MFADWWLRKPRFGGAFALARSYTLRVLRGCEAIFLLAIKDEARFRGLRPYCLCFTKSAPACSGGRF